MLKFWREQMVPMYHEEDGGGTGSEADPPVVETPEEEEETPKKKSAVQIRIDKLTKTITDLRTQNTDLLKADKERADKKLADEKNFKKLYEQGEDRIKVLEADLAKATEYQTKEFAKKQERWTKVKAGIPETHHELFDMETDDDVAVIANLDEYDKMVRLKVLTGSGSGPAGASTETTTTDAADDEVDEHSPLVNQIEREAKDLE